jgi:ABC-type bacteriocin/lantibiotic exporter with double-glycine peptidase domain
LPFASLIVLGNWFLPVMGFLAGIVWRRVPGGVWRKSISVVALGVSGGYATLAPLLGRAPDCRDNWEHGVCVQTTNKTCTPACAATLLSWHGIPAREQEMAELCLTRDGTTWQGLYRGLKLKTVGTPWDVQVVQCESERLKELSGSPLILSVGLERDVSADREYETEWGWTPGVRHSVVLRGFTVDGQAEIADPAPNSTFERWSPETLRVLWRGTAVRLVPRNG